MYAGAKVFTTRWLPVGRQSLEHQSFTTRESGASRSWGSGSPGQVGDGIDFGIEQRFEAGSELAVEDSALEQEIGAPAGPPHLLGFVHAAVDQEVGGPFRDRRADP